jgi:hypothetical protein
MPTFSGALWGPFRDRPRVCVSNRRCNAVTTFCLRVRRREDLASLVNLLTDTRPTGRRLIDVFAARQGDGALKLSRIIPELFLSHFRSIQLRTANRRLPRSVSTPTTTVGFASLHRQHAFPQRPFVSAPLRGKSSFPPCSDSACVSLCSSRCHAPRSFCAISSPDTLRNHSIGVAGVVHVVPIERAAGREAKPQRQLPPLSKATST